MPYWPELGHLPTGIIARWDKGSRESILHVSIEPPGLGNFVFGRQEVGPWRKITLDCDNISGGPGAGSSLNSQAAPIDLRVLDVPTLNTLDQDRVGQEVIGEDIVISAERLDILT